MPAGNPKVGERWLFKPALIMPGTRELDLVVEVDAYGVVAQVPSGDFLSWSTEAFLLDYEYYKPYKAVLKELL